MSLIASSLLSATAASTRSLDAHANWYCWRPGPFSIIRYGSPLLCATATLMSRKRARFSSKLASKARSSILAKSACTSRCGTTCGAGNAVYLSRFTGTTRAKLKGMRLRTGVSSATSVASTPPGPSQYCVSSSRKNAVFVGVASGGSTTPASSLQSWILNKSCLHVIVNASLPSISSSSIAGTTMLVSGSPRDIVAKDCTTDASLARNARALRGFDCGSRVRKTNGSPRIARSEVARSKTRASQRWRLSYEMISFAACWMSIWSRCLQ